MRLRYYNAVVDVEQKFQKSVICLLEKNNRFSALKTRWSEEGLRHFPSVGYTRFVRQLPRLFFTWEGRAENPIPDGWRLVGHTLLSGWGERKWCLFTYDAKNRLLEGNIMNPFSWKEKQACLEGGGCRENIATFGRIFIKVKIMNIEDAKQLAKQGDQEGAIAILGKC